MTAWLVADRPVLSNRTQSHGHTDPAGPPWMFSPDNASLTLVPSVATAKAFFPHNPSQ